ncbi:HIT family protein [Halobacillus sp. BBL2006]|uniref:HIT family protein n=1 Tax=Halobacillus sp. BBL2006 TaxID=1543706 RepID=UPI000542AFB5|nr:HIT family protein [Halobacillus sp. BBL2006]KHE67903.1 cell-cycle regulation histidine triad HIT protein [Halobacillus sp. BBL2006]
MSDCVFCMPELDMDQRIVFENESCMFLQKDQPVLKGSGLIVPKAHKRTVFDLSSKEWSDTQEMLLRVKHWLDEIWRPEGYNIGYNCGEVGGQHIFHAHLHVIPRFSDEPYAGRGLRHWLKQEANRRNT